MPRTKQQFAELREEKKEVILSSALRLFARKGYDDVSIADIARTAKISTGLSYHYFKSKQKILEGIVERFTSMAEGKMKDIESLDDPFDQLKGIFEGMFSLIENNKDLALLFFSLVLQPGVMGKIKKCTSDSANNMLKVFEKILSSLGFSNPGLEAKFIDVFFDGIFLNYLTSEGKFPLGEMKNLLLQRYSKENLNEAITRNRKVKSLSVR